MKAIVFNEGVHAYLSARFYTRLTQAFGPRGRAAFIHAVQYYAGQRGRRMAQRAIRDGRELTFAVFLQYGELVPTQPNDRELASLSPDWEIHITTCPWHRQFQEMGCGEAGDVYCTYLDEALCRGFNPAIPFQVLSNLNTGDRCVHRVVGTYYDALPDGPPKNEYKKDFSYHCGHLYWSFSEVAAAIFGEAGEAVNAGVLSDLTADYGVELAHGLLRWQDTNFNVC